jgi:hypothetical protein
MTFTKLTEAQRRQASLPILIAARKAVVLDGALPIEAIQEAGQGGLVCHFARQVLLSVTPSATLQAWQLDPTVKQSDRTRAFDRAIRLARGAFGHRGGWAVSKPSTTHEAA